MRHNEVRVEFQFVPGSRGELINTGRARLKVDADVSTELAAEMLRRLKELTSCDPADFVAADAGAGI